MALLISQSSFLFNAMKYLAGAYLIYLGAQSVRAFIESAEHSYVEQATSEQCAEGFYVRVSNKWAKPLKQPYSSLRFLL